MIHTLIQAIISGVLLGGIYAAIAVGLALVWGVMKTLNIAHAALSILGVYLTFTLMSRFGMDPLATLLVTVPVLFLIGVILQRFVVRPLRNRKEADVHALLILYGIMIIIENMSVYIWTADVRAISFPYANSTVLLGNIAFPLGRVVSFLLSVFTLFIVYFYLTRSRSGLAVRATAYDQDAASLVGINVNRITMATFGIGTATASVAGLALGVVFSFSPGIQIVWLSKAFLVVVLGGVDNILGILLAAILLGVAESIVGNYAPLFLVDFVAYALLFLSLMFRPQGLLGRRE